MTLNLVITFALLATTLTLGLGLLSMAIGGTADRQFGEHFMWARIIIQAFAVVLISLALYMSYN